MLSIPAFDQVDGLILFRDDVETNRFYYLPRNLRLQTSSDGKPMFTFLRYQFPLQRPDGGEPGAGYLVFSTTLQEDAALIETKVKPRLAAVLQAENAHAASVPQPVIAPVDFTEGSANLIIMKDNRMVKTVTLGRPSLFADNTVSVAVELSSDAATLFYEALTHGGSIAAIEYDLRFPVRLPAVTIIGHVDAHEVKEVVMGYTTEHVTDESVWGDTHHNVQHRTSISEKMESMGLVTLEVLKGTVELTQEDMESLRAFAFSAMDDFIKKHFLTGGTVETAEDRKNEWMQFLGQDVRSRFDLNVSYRDVILREYNPSAQINPSFVGGDPASVIQDIDLQNAPWYYNTLTVKVDTNLDFEKYGELVHSVVGHLSYDQTKPDGTHIAKRQSVAFTKSANAVQTFETRIAAPGKDKYHVDLEVNYTGGNQLQSRLGSFDSTVRNLTLSVPNPGVMEVKFSASPKAFGDNLTAIEVEVEYADPRNEVPRAVETLILDAQHAEQDYQRVLYAPFDKTYRYRATHVIGNQRSTSPWIEASSATRYVTINTPFDQEFGLTILASADWKEVSQVIVDVEYNDAASDYRMVSSFAFQKDTPARQNWKFPIRDPQHREFTFTQTLLFASGAVVASDTQTRPSDAQVLVVGNAPGGVVTIEVDPADVGLGATVSRAIARLTYSDPQHDVLDTETLVFRDGQTKEWQIARADHDRNAYLYDVEYYLKDGTRRKLADQPGAITSIRDILILPPPPPA